MSKTATARTNRIRSRMNSRRTAAITTGSGVHARKVHALRPTAVVAKQAGE
jgi:phosphomannomutase